ncbi:MAG TPA: MMPL family transporter [Candidatus Limnocylindrales bacterium]|nr:MMPL family transporter [Candidatus Limnocylindrales bacterium]
MFGRWGRFVYRWRWATLVVSIILLGGSIYGLMSGGTLGSGNSTTSGLEADRASNLINAQLSSGKTGGSDFLLIFSSPNRSAADAGFKAAVESALAPIVADPRVSSIISPYNAANPAIAQALMSRDGHKALVQVRLNAEGSQARADYAALLAVLHPRGLSVVGTGNVPINRDFNTTLESDLQRAETVSLPLTLILLLLIFGTVVAAGLPLGIGVFTIVGGLAGTFLLSRFTDVSQYALNIVTMIGLAVAIDYSLFIVNRYRDELAAGKARPDALATTMSTAGRAITFSGLAVAVGLSAMLFYQGTFLASMGAAGAIVVAVAVFYGLTFLPALLAVLGTKVNRLPIPIISRRPSSGRGIWHRVANWVMRRPVVVLLPALAFLVVAGTPFLHLRLANADVEQLPARLESRQGFDTLVKSFPGQDQTTFDVVVDYPTGTPQSPERIADQAGLARRIAGIPGVLRVETPRLGAQIALLTVVSNQPASSDGARTILRAIRAEPVHAGGALLVTGQTAFDVDIITYILGRTPLAVGFVVLVTCLVLFLLTGSLLLPLKAVVLNLLSISASFGALVWIFQDGHLSQQLGFTAQSIDPSVPVILFAIVFGMSMDYEVLLISRIQEAYLRTGDNTHAIAEGLERSGRLITGAAAIMVAVFLAFGLAEVVLIKSIGIGLAIAVALDATIVRAAIVPAIMRILGRYNWWAPAPLHVLHRRAGLGRLAESAAEVA